MDSVDVMYKAGKVRSTAHTPEQIAAARRYRSLATAWCIKNCSHEMMYQIDTAYEQGVKRLPLDRSAL